MQIAYAYVCVVGASELLDVVNGESVGRIDVEHLDEVHDVCTART